MTSHCREAGATAFGGCRLRGDKLVRYVYVDEAGISGQEPVTIVCGVVVHADTQWRSLSLHLDELKNKHVPEEHRPGFVFHGKDLANGGLAFPRTIPREERLRILGEVASSVKKLGLPVVVGYSKRQYHKPFSDMSSEQLDQLLAFTICIALADDFLRSRYPDEIAQLVVENSGKMQRHLKRAHTLLKEPVFTALLPKSIQDLLPLSQIVAPVHFAYKEDEPHLQVADACAYAVRRYASGLSFGSELAKAVFYDDDVDMSGPGGAICSFPES